MALTRSFQSLRLITLGLALGLGLAASACSGATLQLRANQPSVFYVDGVEVGRGRFVTAQVPDSHDDTIKVVAKAEGYRDKSEFFPAPSGDKTVEFLFEVGDKADGKDSWGRKTADVDRAATAQPAARAAAASPGAPAPAALPQPLQIPMTLHAAPNNKRFAVVVGIETYSNGLPSATGAVRDAVTFGDVAARALGVPKSHIVMLTDERATRTAIEARLTEWLPRVLTGVEDSELYFFFAGHGAPDPVTGDAYLVPWDADPKFLKSQGLRVSTLHADLSASGAKAVYVFLDSCFSGSGGRSVLAAGTRPLVRIKDVGISTPPEVKGQNMQLYASFAAAGPSEVTGRSRDADAGLFTYHLVTGLAGAADTNGDHQVTLEELSTYVRTRVEQDARLDNRDQTPVMTVAKGDTSAVVTTH